MTAEPAAATRYTATYPGRADQLHHVRRAVASHLAGCAAAADAVLVASELFFPRFESVSPKLCPTSGSCLPAGSSCGQEHPSSPRIFARSATEADLRTLAALLPLPRSRLSRRPVKAGCLMRHAECGEELAANAILHSRSRAGHFTVRTELHPDHVRIEAEDLGGPWRSRQPDGRPHGLDMVEALTRPDGWGTETTTAGGRIVWARLDLEAAGE